VRLIAEALSLTDRRHVPSALFREIDLLPVPFCENTGWDQSLTILPLLPQLVNSEAQAA
jgi:hypothetical protein